MNYLYSNYYPNIPIFDHTIKFTIYLGLLDYLTNILHVIQCSRRRWASLNRTRKNILLRSLQMCFLPSRLFPEFEIVPPTQFVTIYRISQPSPARRVSMESQCRSTNLKKFSKIEQDAAPGPTASRSSACPFSKREGQNSRQRHTQRFYPHSEPPHYSLINSSLHTIVTIAAHQD